MIDWHSHVLPGVDDGAHDIGESLSMLGMLSEQNADTVCATPHFYANASSIEEFLERRAEAAELLASSAGGSAPRILLGAEVKYYPGISKLSRLFELGIEGTRMLLVEMPHDRWTEYTQRELVELSGAGRATIMLAHIERYLKLQPERTWERLYESGITAQVNASFLTSALTRHRALSMLRDGRIHFIGSDCHNTTRRAPDIGRAYDIVTRKLGCEFALDMDEFGHSMLL